MHDVFKKVIPVVLFVAIFSFNQTQAQVKLDLRGGYYQEAEDFFLGAGLNFNLLFFTAVPNFEYVFVSGGDFYTINLDGYVTVLPLVAGSGWLGGGFVLSSAKPSGGESDVSGGVNLLAGFGLDKIPLKPYAQLKYIIADNSQFVIGVGVRL
jgi:hypothetical protein